MTKNEILEECRSIIDEVCEKYHYNCEDVEGNDSLRTVLLKAIPAMLVNSPKKDRELFYQMLSHTPIVVTENLKQEGYDELVEKYIRNVTSPIEVEEDLGEYGKRVGKGEYVSEPIIDENMQIKGKKSFLYVQKLTDDKEKEFLGTDINVSDLIHELGHAWNAEKDEYKITEDKKLIKRVGTAKFIYSVTSTEDGKFILKFEKITGLLIEEGLNTIAQEEAMARYMGISKEEMKRKYTSILEASPYQGLISYSVEYLSEEFSGLLKNWRLNGDENDKNKLENFMQKTEFWQNRETDILLDSKSCRSYHKKKEILAKIDRTEAQEFFQKYENVYFPDIANMTPLEKVDNGLEQFFYLTDIRRFIDSPIAAEFIMEIGNEFYPLIHQAAQIKVKQEIEGIAAGVRSGEVDKITKETQNGIKNLTKENENEIQGEIK